MSAADTLRTVARGVVDALSLRGVRCAPQRTRIDAIWIELQHPLVEFLSALRFVVEPIEVPNVFPGGVDVPRTVVAVGYFVSDVDGGGLHRLDFLQVGYS